MRPSGTSTELTMKYSLHFAARGLLATLAFTFALSANDLSKEELGQLKDEVSETISNFKKADSTIGPLFESAAGYAVLPKIAKGGFIVGGARGTGLVFDQGKLLGHVTMSQATLGAQVGGQSFSQVIFFETAEALKNFQNSEFTMNAQIGAVAAGEGVAKNAKYTQGVAVFTLARSGLMAEASVGGQKFTFSPIKE